MGKGPWHALADYLGPFGGKGAGSGPLQFPDGAPSLEHLMLLCPADGHDGSVQRGGGPPFFPGLCPHFFQNGLLPLRGKHGHARFSLQLGHPLGTGHAAQEQRKQLAVNLVDLIPELS